MPFVQDRLLESDTHLSYLVETLITDKDTPVQEFSTLILAEISKDPYGTAKILECQSNFDILFELMKSPDPDVMKNTIELVNNLLRDPAAVKPIVSSQVDLSSRDKLIISSEAEMICYFFRVSASRLSTNCSDNPTLLSRFQLSP